MCCPAEEQTISSILPQPRFVCFLRDKRLNVPMASGVLASHTAFVPSLMPTTYSEGTFCAMICLRHGHSNSSKKPVSVRRKDAGWGGKPGGSTTIVIFECKPWAISSLCFLSACMNGLCRPCCEKQKQKIESQCGWVLCGSTNTRWYLLAFYVIMPSASWLSRWLDIKILEEDQKDRVAYQHYRWRTTRKGC